jgi:omega-6 fatty acid desaturase (delta-12 desaturase)
LFLATKPFASDDPWVSWRHILLAAGLLALAIAGTLWFVHPLPRLGCSVLTAFLMLRMFVIYHDQQHYAILPDSRVAEVVMWVFGVWALSPSSVWRSSHNHHHAHNSRLRGSHIGSFPIMTAEAFRKASPSARRKYLFMRHPATIALGYFFIFIVGMCLKPFFSNPRRHWDALVAILLHVAIGLGLAWWGGWRAVVYTQTLPCLLLYAIGSYLFYVQHNFPGVQFRDQSEWTHEGAAMESSSFLRLGPVMTWFSANIGYHHIHHLNSRIPFYRLPETMSAIPELQTARGSSLHPLEVYRCLRLKVWDVAAQRMTRV